MYYQPETLYSICTGLIWLLRGLDKAHIYIFFLSAPTFVCFKKTLDSLMKQLKAASKYHRHKAEVITSYHEDLLWQKGILGAQC